MNEHLPDVFRAILNAHAAIPDVLARTVDPCVYHLWIKTADGDVCVQCGERK